MFTIEVSKLSPNKEFIEKLLKNKDEVDNYLKTSERTVFTVKLNKSDEKTDESTKYDFYTARNVFFKYQHKFPVKYLQASPNNRYVCQKSMLSEYSTNIESASKQIEPFNIGFDHYIQLIPINQDLKEGTTFVIELQNPYESSETDSCRNIDRKFFRSKSLKTYDENNKYCFNHNIHIGTLDIGSKYTGKFTVTNSNNTLFSTPINKFNFKCDDNSFSLIWYDYIFNFKEPIEVFKQLLEESRTFSELAYDLFKDLK